MDASELAKMMLQWESVKRRLDEIEEAIKDTVLQMEKTQTVGNVRASFSAGRKKYDYEGAIEAAESEGQLEPGCLMPFEKVVIDYRSACKAFGINDVPFTQGEPSVSVKLLA